MATSAYGPFTVNGGNLKTGIMVHAGDGISVEASGEVDFGGAVLGLGAPIVGPGGDPFEVTPNSYPAPQLRKNSLICRVGPRVYQAGHLATFSPVDDGELMLLTNDDQPQDNSRGWTVYVYHTSADTPMPQIGSSWSMGTVDGVGGIFGANVGRSPAAVTFRHPSESFLREHVFYNGDGKLHHFALDYEHPYDQNHERREVIDGTDAGVAGATKEWIWLQVSAAVHNGEIHVFYFDWTFRHAVGDGVNWRLETLDGAGGADGRITGIVGAFSTALSWGNELHVFYYWSTEGEGEGIPRLNLKHAVLDAADDWSFEVLDGAGGSDGRIDADVGASISAVGDAEDVMHVFYYDQTNKDLRHAWRTLLPTAWHFETLDGAGDPNTADNPPDGQIRAHVGVWSACVMFDGDLYVCYHDLTWGNVRLATKPAGQQPWRFEKLDGGAINGALANGRIKAHVGGGINSAVAFLDQVSLFYWDATNENLRHAWKKRGSNWSFQTLDGDVDGGWDGRRTGRVGEMCSAITHVSGFSPPFTTLTVYYSDAGNNDLRRAWRHF